MINPKLLSDGELIACLEEMRHRDADALRALSPPEPTEGQARIDEIAREVTAEVKREIEAADALGKWMSAALDDPKVCVAMKADITQWFEAGQPVPRAMPLQERGWPDQEYQAVVTKAEQLRAALKLIVEQIEDYERVNNLAPNTGRQHCWDSVAQDRVLLAEQETNK